MLIIAVDCGEWPTERERGRERETVIGCPSLYLPLSLLKYYTLNTSSHDDLLTLIQVLHTEYPQLSTPPFLTPSPNGRMRRGSERQLSETGWMDGWGEVFIQTP